MLDFSWSHILILLIVALVVVGPKDLPRLMRIVGQWMGKARAMADQFKKSFDDMARQTELDELRKEIDNLRNERPLADVERDLNRAIIPEEMRSSVPPPQSVSAEPVETESAPHLDPPQDVPDPGEYGLPDEPVTASGYTPPKP
jgi:sec-independent protein translocase protein TatB